MKQLYPDATQIEPNQRNKETPASLSVKFAEIRWIKWLNGRVPWADLFAFLSRKSREMSIRIREDRTRNWRQEIQATIGSEIRDCSEWFPWHKSKKRTGYHRLCQIRKNWIEKWMECDEKRNLNYRRWIKTTFTAIWKRCPSSLNFIDVTFHRFLINLSQTHLWIPRADDEMLGSVSELNCSLGTMVLCDSILTVIALIDCFRWRISIGFWDESRKQKWSEEVLRGNVTLQNQTDLVKYLDGLAFCFRHLPAEWELGLSSDRAITPSKLSILGTPNPSAVLSFQISVI
jgi:hypothetical protein